MILEEKEDLEIIKIYSKGITGVIERFCEIIKLFIFISILIFVTISQYWIVHWVIFGRTVYSDIFYYIDNSEL